MVMRATAALPPVPLKEEKQMSRKPSIVSLRKRFDAVLEADLALFRQLEPWTSKEGNNTGNPLGPGQAKRAIEGAFLHGVAAWEDFLEQTFVRYLAGADFFGAKELNLRTGKATSIAHAYHILKGTTDFKPEKGHLVWTSWKKDVVERARVYFRDGHPYTSVPDKHKQSIANAVNIRNRVAHSSPKCKAAFTKLVHECLKPDKGDKDKLPWAGFMVGDFLVHKAVRQFGQGFHTKTYFEAFSFIFGEMANVIAPVPADDSDCV
jgi:hypothetical protein